MTPNNIPRGAEPSADPQAADPQARVVQDIIAAAGQVFADHGYEGTSVRQICKAAGVNVASVSYYFGGKAGLYREVLFGTHQRVFKRAPLPSASPEMNGEQQLRQWIHWFVHHLLDQDNKPAWLPVLLTRELGKPSSVLSEVVSQTMRPIYLELQSRLKAFVGKPVPELRLRLMTQMVIAPCVFYVQSKEIINRIDSPLNLQKQCIDQLSQAIQSYAIGGLKALIES